MKHDPKPNSRARCSSGPPAPSLAVVVEARQALTRWGMVDDTGRTREGKTVWAVSAFGGTVWELAKDGDEEAAGFVALVTTTDDQAEILRRGDALSVRLGIPWMPVRTPWPQR